MEVGGGIEVLVHARETQVAHVVDEAQFVEHREPDNRRRDLGTVQAHDVFDARCHLLEFVVGHPPTLRRRSQPGNDLRPLERHDCAGRLDDGQGCMVDALEGRETVRAGQTLAATPDRCAVLGHPGIDDLAVVLAT
jgi:hypothetical protein